MAKELGVPVFLYAKSANKPDRVRLPDIRKGEYEALEEKFKDPSYKPDYGKPVFVPKSGTTATGCRDILLAYNINLNTNDKSIASKISGKIRTSGVLKKDKPHRILCEFEVDPLPDQIEQVVISSGEFFLKRRPRGYTIPFTIALPVRDDTEEAPPPPTDIFRAISHLTFYRLQEKAQDDVASGNPGTAFQRLINLSSHLMSKGEDALAKIAMNEADYIKTHNNFSPTGKKQLKYGTIRLMLPEKT